MEEPRALEEALTLVALGVQRGKAEHVALANVLRGPVGDPAEIGRLSRLPLTPWAPGGRDHYIVLRAEWLSGRRLLVGRRPGDAQGAQGNGTLQRSVKPDG
jgi:hypothetical protein